MRSRPTWAYAAGALGVVAVSYAFLADSIFTTEFTKFDDETLDEKGEVLVLGALSVPGQNNWWKYQTSATG